MRRGREPQEVRKEIMDAARHLFLDQGYNHVSMRNIAGRIGYSPTTIYIYFKNKEEILYCLLEEGYSIFYNELKTAFDNNLEASLETRLHTLCEAYICFGLNQPDYYRLIFTDNLETNVTWLIRSDRYNGFLLLVKVVEALLQENSFASPLPDSKQSAALISQTLWAHLHGLTSLLLSFPQFDWVKREQLVFFHIDAFIQGLKTRPV